LLISKFDKISCDSYWFKQVSTIIGKAKKPIILILRSFFLGALEEITI